MLKSKSPALQLGADVVGTVGSSLCALHCAILPLSLVLGTTLPLTLMGEGDLPSRPAVFGSPGRNRGVQPGLP